MKRFGHLFDKIIALDNLYLATKNAQKGKKKAREIKEWNRNLTPNILRLHWELRSKSYVVSEYVMFTIYEPKERIISKLPFKDRIVHHAILIHLIPIFTRMFIAQTYSCIKGRGVHRCSYDLRIALKDVAGTTYCLKMDIRKFYPSVDNGILKEKLRTKFKDIELLWLLDLIIDSKRGLPLGSYISQWFGNFYTSKLDHWIKEEKRIKYYFKYNDDMVILGSDKTELHALRREIETYLKENLKLELSNYQVFPIDVRGIDYVGYVHFHTHTLLRKSIKERFKKMIRTRKNQRSITSYNGWIKHCNGKNLTNKYL